MLPSRSQYNRRVQQLPTTVAILLPRLARELGLDRERIRIIDSAPVSVVSYALSDKSRCFPRGQQTNYGYCPAQKKRYYGCKLHLVTSKHGVPLSYQLGPANEHDVNRLVPLGRQLARRTWLLGDKGYLSYQRRDYLKDRCGVTVLHPQQQRHGTNPPWARALLQGWRGNIKTTFSQLKEQMGLERLRAQSYQGLEGRVAGAVFSYVVGVRFNQRYCRPRRALKSILL